MIFLLLVGETFSEKNMQAAGRGNEDMVWN